MLFLLSSQQCQCTVVIVLVVVVRDLRIGRLPSNYRLITHTLASLYTVPLSAINGLSRLTTMSNGQSRPIRKFSNRPMTFESNQNGRFESNFESSQVRSSHGSSVVVVIVVVVVIIILVVKIVFISAVIVVVVL